MMSTLLRLRNIRHICPFILSRTTYRQCSTDQFKRSLNLFEKGDLVPMVNSNVIKLGTVEDTKEDALYISGEWIDLKSHRLDAQQLLERWDHKRLFKLQMNKHSIRIGTKYWNIHRDEIKLAKALITLRMEDYETLKLLRKFLDDYAQRLEDAVDTEWFHVSSRSISLVKRNKDTGKETEILAFGSVFGQDRLTRGVELLWSPVHCAKAYQQTKQNPLPLFRLLCANAMNRYDTIDIESLERE